MVVPKTPIKLAITPEPFKPSYLSIPPSPFSPKTPFSLISHPPPRLTKAYPTPEFPTPPSPLQWLWQCHQCRRTYSLGVTRRCLEDGHHFCAGTTTVKAWRKPLRLGKVRRHRACASEFDYQGWKTWGRWRRSGQRDLIYHENSSASSSDSSFSTSSEESAETQPLSPPAKDCWNVCDYPSECRWGKRFGIHTPITTTFPTIELPTPPPPYPAPSTTFEGILKPENCKEVKKEKTDFWGALVASATRRKSHPPGSPLASVSEESEGSSLVGEQPLLRDGDGDVVMTSFDALGMGFSEPVAPVAATTPDGSFAV
jgi:hypothetical protein